MNDIQQKSYEGVTEKLEYLSPKDRGAYFHGWFDCLCFVEQMMKSKDKEKELD